jgi:hypothetical protein
VATSIRVNGVQTSRPGSYNEVDASGLETVSLGATGIVAVIGTAEGGVPVSAIASAENIVALTSPDQALERFRSGDLREAIPMAFSPANDPQIPGGAQAVVALKVNPASQSSAVLADGASRSVMTITSRDYGAFTEQVNIALSGAGARTATVGFEADSESFDNLGGVNVLTLEYEPPAGGNGWTSMLMDVISTGIRATGSRSVPLAAITATAFTSGNTITAESSSAGDTTQTLTVYGLNAGGQPVREVLQLNGTTAVVGTQTWQSIFGARLSAACAGTVTVGDTDNTPAANITIAPAALESGMLTTSALYVAGDRPFVTGGVGSLIVWGRNASGGLASEVVTLPGGTAIGRLANSYSIIEQLVLGGVTTASVLTATAAETQNATQSTLQSVLSYFNGRFASGAGFIATGVSPVLSMSPTTFDMTPAAGVSIQNVAGGIAADLQAIIDGLSGSSFVSASAVAFAPQISTVTIGTADAATTYTVTVAGTAVTATGAGTQAAVVAALVAAINGHPTLYRQVTAAASGTNTLTVTGDYADAFTISVGAAGGTGTITLALTQAVTGVRRAPVNTSAPVFLTGGAEGTALTSHWTAALTLLRDLRVNLVVPLTGDPAIHALVRDHCRYMAGIGRSERSAIVGLSALDGSNLPTNVLPARASILSQIQALNSQHVRACAQSVDRFDTSGTRRTFLPWFLAVIAAGMEAGSAVGLPSTFKIANVLAVYQDSSWNPRADADAMINGGLWFMERVAGLGIRVVRNITTHLASNNLAFIEASVKQAVDFATYNFRTRMEASVGQRGSVSTLNGAKSIATSILNQLLAEGAITNWRSLQLRIEGDQLLVAVEITPVTGINFVRSTIYLNAARLSA